LTILGILLLDTTFPRIPGDVGNERSYPFPVHIKKVHGATVQRVVYDADPTLRELFIDAARELESEGVVAITSSCGFLSPIQKDVAEAVNIPVFLSSLMQVPFAYAMTQRKVAIVTANSQSMTELVRESAGITSNIPIEVVGMEDVTAFRDPILKDGATLDRKQIEDEMVIRTERLLQKNPEIGSFVFECHNLAPYAQAVQAATNKPVFDIIDFANLVYNSVKKKAYPD
jgi:Asp/Glu/hydantoin racemase